MKKIFNDPVHGFISFQHPIYLKVIDHPYFQRLRRIAQLGLTNYVYPGANHTRFHHAMGSFHLMKIALQTLREKGIEITEEEEIGACLGILLHDIGHGPFSHALENTIIKGVSHEDISMHFMDALNEEFDGALTLAISIFKGDYKKKFLHSLISGQLDVDRLDYLTRDSFYTGVNEGVISHDRILKMLYVQNDELVVEQKGIYSIEHFLISRRLMYWQVYLHKTVLCAEMMLIKAMERAKQLAERGVELKTTEALHYFLYSKHTPSFIDQSTLSTFALLDDFDVMTSLKFWTISDDSILRFLSTSILNRNLFTVMVEPTANLEQERKKYMEQHHCTEEEANYFVFELEVANTAYNVTMNTIQILDKGEQLTDIALASDFSYIQNLSEKVSKRFMFIADHQS